MNVIHFLNQLKTKILKDANLRPYIEDDVALDPKGYFPSSTSPLRPTKPISPSNHSVQPFSPSNQGIERPSGGSDRMAPSLDFEAPSKDPAIANLVRIFKRQYDKMLSEEMSDLSPMEKEDFSYEDFNRRYRSKAMQGILRMKEPEKSQYTTAIDEVIRPTSESFPESSVYQELKDGYISLLERAKANGTSKMVNEEFIKQYGSDPRFKPYMRQFLQEISTNVLPQEKSPIMRQPEPEIGDLDMQEILGLIHFNGEEAVRNMPEIADNPTNQAALEKAINSIIDSKGINRKALADDFLQDYLGLGANTTGRTDPQTLNRLFKIFIRNKSDIEDMDEKTFDKKMQNYTGSEEDRLAVSDVIRFIKEVLFMPDTYGKESVGKFMLDRKTGQFDNLKQILKANGASDEEIAQLDKNTKDKINTQENHAIISPYYGPISEYVHSLIKAKDKTFFDWATREAYRDYGRGMAALTRQAPAVKGENGDFTTYDFADEKHGFGDELSSEEEDKYRFSDENNLGESEDESPVGAHDVSNFDDEEAEARKTQKILSEEGLAKKQIINKGVVQPAKLANFFRNYKKIRSYFEDMSHAIDRQYAELKSKYDPNSKTDSMRQEMIGLLQKKSLYKLMFDVADKRMNNLFINAKGGLPVTDDRLLSLLNQDWSRLLTYTEFMKNSDRSMNNPIVAQTVQQALQDQLGYVTERKIKTDENEETETDPDLNQLIQPKSMQVDLRDPENMRQEMFEIPTKTGMWVRLKNFEKVLLDPEIVNKYGKDAAISFIDLVGSETRNIRLGALLANSNSKAVIDTKIEYLSELARRGTITEFAANQIEHNMSVEEINSLFDRFRRDLVAFHGSEEDRIKMLLDNPYITDQDIAKAGSTVGVNSKKDFQSADSKRKKVVLKSIYNYDLFKKVQLHSEQEPALITFLAKSLNQQFSGNSVAFYEFLSRIGLGDVSAYDIENNTSGLENALKTLPSRRLQEVAEVYYPDLYKAFRLGRLKKTTKIDSDDIMSVVKDLANASMSAKERKGALPSGGLQEALVFAKILELPRKQDGVAPAKAASSLYVQRKIASLKRQNALCALRQKFSQRNVDVSVLDSLIAELLHDGR